MQQTFSYIFYGQINWRLAIYIIVVLSLFAFAQSWMATTLGDDDAMAGQMRLRLLFSEEHEGRCRIKLARKQILRSEQMHRRKCVRLQIKRFLIPLLLAWLTLQFIHGPAKRR